MFGECSADSKSKSFFSSLRPSKISLLTRGIRGFDDTYYCLQVFGDLYPDGLRNYAWRFTKLQLALGLNLSLDAIAAFAIADRLIVMSVDSVMQTF